MNIALLGMTLLGGVLLSAQSSINGAFRSKSGRTGKYVFDVLHRHVAACTRCPFLWTRRCPDVA